MTTITNFLHSSFVQTHTTIQKPIWVLKGSPSTKIHILKEYLINQCASGDPTNRVVVRVDFGVGAYFDVRNSSKVWKMGNGVSICLPKEGLQYLLVSVGAGLRGRFGDCLGVVREAILGLPFEIAKYLPNQTPKSSFCLLIQNIQSVSPVLAPQEQHRQISSQLQSFINKLTDSPYKQTTIITYSMGNILLPEHEFALERISTCLTEILKYDDMEKGRWSVKSTLRRYDGYSKQQYYTITMHNNHKIKVTKSQTSQKQQQTQSQKQMLSDLGFVVTKHNQSHNSDTLKQMIYPHLRIINQATGCGCGSGSGCSSASECGCGGVRPEDEGLIVLDDEQEDDDDIDV